MKRHTYLAAILTLIFCSCSTEEPVPTFILTVSVSPAEAGKITLSPQSANYKEGEIVTLTAVPNENWVFENWEGDGSGNLNPLQITMTSNKSVVGLFVKNLTLSLNCSSAINKGKLTPGVPVIWTNDLQQEGVVSTVIPYSSTSPIPLNIGGQTITSTGVTGLTATLKAGNWGNGKGNLTYIITGTPSALGIASFEINISGEKCKINRMVTAALVSGEVMSNTGRIWMDRNLGASRVATSSTDAASYGDLYQWGRGADGHQLRNSLTTTNLSSLDQPGNGNFIRATDLSYNWRNPQNSNLWQGVNGINNPCPNGYRLPTAAEWDEEQASWISRNASGAFASPLKLPMAGYRYRTNGSLRLVGSGGFYWSSTVVGIPSLPNSRKLTFNSSIFESNDTYYRADGFSVRCIKD